MNLVTCPNCHRRVKAEKVCSMCGSAFPSLDAPRKTESATESTATSKPAPKPKEKCVLCGNTDATLVTFFIRTMSGKAKATSVSKRWMNFEEKCCADCFQRVSSLQSLKLWAQVFGFGPIVAVGLYAGFSEVESLPPALIAVAFLPMLAGIITLAWIGMKRQRLVRTEHFTPVMEFLKSYHGLSTGDKRVHVIPLATVKQGGAFFESER